MNIIKKIAAFLLKFLLIVVILVVVAALGLYIYYLATINQSADYLPQQFLLYAKATSIKNIYDNAIDLKAADVIFSSADLKTVYQSILEFKSNELSKNELFRKLLEVKADVIVHDDYTLTVAFDLGPLSLATRMFPIFSLFFKIKGLITEYSDVCKKDIYIFAADEKQKIYFTFQNNLVFVSTQKSNIENLYVNKNSAQNLKNNDSVNALKGKIKQQGLLDLYISTNSILQNILENNTELKQMLADIDFNSISAVSFDISNDKLNLNAYTNIYPRSEIINSFLDYKPTLLKVIKYLPESTNIYSSVNFKSFEQLLKVMLYLRKGEFDKTLKDINGAINMLLKKDWTVNDLIFSWMGSEIGVFTVDGSPDPLVFVEVKDTNKFSEVIDVIRNSAVLEGDSSLLIDGVRISRISFPPFIKMLVENFVKGIEFPYYLTINDFLFLSASAENLARLENDYKSGKILIRKENYRTITQAVPKNANLFLYYDMASTLPSFLPENSMISRILRLYEKGVLSFNFNNTEVKISISCGGVAGDKTRPFPGYPLALNNGTRSRVLCADIKGSKIPELIYVNTNNQLVIQDIISGNSQTAQVEADSQPVIMRTAGGTYVFAFSNSGALFKFNTNAESQDPFPLITVYKGSFTPLAVGEKLLFYAKSEKALLFCDKDGKESRFNFELSNPVLSPPVLFRDKIVFYPKNFSGSVYVANLDGQIENGWPLDGGGISYCSPFFYTDSSGQVMVIFLVQSGQLNVWTLSGLTVNQFPLKLDGVFYVNPRVISYNQGKEKGILCLSESGTLYLVNFRGEVVRQKQIADIVGRQTDFVLFDMENDGDDEIFIYGSKNFISGLDSNFMPLPGFPVKGSERPYFYDLNFNGQYEIIAPSFDNNIYVYTLSK